MTCAPIPCLDIPTPARPASAGTALPWPPSGRQSAWKPTGGFFQCPTPYLTLPWALYQHGALSFLSLRTWCGVLELPERRHDFVRDHEVHYSVDELRRLLQVPRLAPVQTALHALEEVGLLTWSSDRIVCFPDAGHLRDRTSPPIRPCRRSSRPGAPGCRRPGVCCAGWPATARRACGRRRRACCYAACGAKGAGVSPAGASPPGGLPAALAWPSAPCTAPSTTCRPATGWRASPAAAPTTPPRSGATAPAR